MNFETNQQNSKSTKFKINEKNSILNDSNYINQNNIDTIKRYNINEINQKKTSNPQNALNDIFCIKSSNLQSIKRNWKKLKKIIRWN